MGPVV